MKNLFIALIAVITVLGSFVPSASADDRRVEVMTDVVQVTVHVQGYKKPYAKTFRLAKPSKTVLKPCTDNFVYDCLYVVGKKGREKEIYSFKANDLNWVSYGKSAYVTSIVTF